MHTRQFPRGQDEAVGNFRGEARRSKSEDETRQQNRVTRHRASTSMYSLTFRVRVATPAQYGRNGTASLQITSHTPNLHVDFIAGACVRSACGVRWAWRITAGL